MESYPALRRWLSALVAVVVVTVVAVAGSLWGRSGEQEKTEAAAVDHKQYPWPLFGGSLSRNMVNTIEHGMPTEWDINEKKNIKWAADLGSKSYGGPVVADGKVFIGTNNEKPRDLKIKGDKGIVMCFDEQTGKFLWQHVHDKLSSGLVNDWPREGICSSPVVEGKRLWYVSNRCAVVCSTTDGEIRWQLDMMKVLDVFPHNLSTSSPLIVGDALFVVTSNGVDEGHINIPSPAAPSFIAVDKNTGKVLWKDNEPSARLLEAPKGADKNDYVKGLVDRGLLLMHGQWSSPVYAVAKGTPQIIFPGGDGWIRAFEPATGKLIWKFDCNPKKSSYKLGGKGTRSDFVATPVVHDDKLYIGVGQDPEHEQGIGHFWCIDITKHGDVSPVNDNFDPKAPENKDSALVWHFGEPSNPKDKVGRNYAFGRTLSTAAVHDGLVYIGELAGYLHCLDARTGQQYWVHDLHAPIWSSAYYVDGKVYMGSDDQTILVFAHGREKKQLAENDMGSKVRATPVAANGTLFVMTENKLYAIAAR